MASDDTKYSHISVSDDDEDDVVIQAGARPAAAAAVASPVVREPAAAAGAEVAEAADEAPRACVSDGAEAHEPGDAYRQADPEDLQGAPMSTMQKAIVAVALLAVAAFAVYYFFLR